MSGPPRGERARERAEELKLRLARLRSGQSVSAADVELANERAEEARGRARAAHIFAAEAHENSARAHDRAALRDPEHAAAHALAASADRQARDADYRLADLERSEPLVRPVDTAGSGQ
jgi:hypothetical protein